MTIMASYAYQNHINALVQRHLHQSIYFCTKMAVVAPKSESSLDGIIFSSEIDITYSEMIQGSGKKTA